MAATAQQRQQLAANVGEHASRFLEEYKALESLLQRYFDLGLDAEQFVAEDFTGTTAHMNETDFINVLSTIEAVQTLMNAGHRANLNKVAR